MKKITLVLLLIVATTTTAQQLYVEGGKTLTALDYKSSDGIRISNLQPTAQSYMGLGYKRQIFTKTTNLLLGANYSSYGAKGSDSAIGNFMEWEASYLGLNFGVTVNILKIKETSVFLSATESVAFFVHGMQTQTHNIINLRNNDDFDTPLITLQAGIGLSHPISENLSFYVHYLYGKSNDTAKGNEVLTFKTNSVSFGLLIDISKLNAATKKIL